MSTGAHGHRRTVERNTLVTEGIHVDLADLSVGGWIDEAQVVARLGTDGDEAQRGQHGHSCRLVGHGEGVLLGE